MSVRRVALLMPALALLTSAALVAPMATKAEAATCVRSWSASAGDSVGTGLGFSYSGWPGGNARVKATYKISGTVKSIRVRMSQGGTSTYTTLLGTSGKKVTKDVAVGYRAKGKGTLWFEPRGDSTTTGRTLYSFCLYRS
ncbi:hypothetical protein [Micromonospora sp. NPDC000442]|uniref:hypothetical protein n=1 Tax=Micromonospora sp. NPDC000442 TaxID=3364217 RepID=UPI0036A52DEC